MPEFKKNMSGWDKFKKEKLQGYSHLINKDAKILREKFDKRKFGGAVLNLIKKIKDFMIGKI